MKENQNRMPPKLSFVLVCLITMAITTSGMLHSYYTSAIQRILPQAVYGDSSDSIFGGSSTTSTSDNSNSDNSKQDQSGNKKHSEKVTNSNEKGQSNESTSSNTNIAPQANSGSSSVENNKLSASTTSSSITNMNNVSIVGIKKDKSFDPNPIEINAGDSVTWTNNDKEVHTVTSGSQDASNIGQEFDSGTLASGQSFTHKFDKAGTYEYFCSFHESMTGKVIVK